VNKGKPMNRAPFQVLVFPYRISESGKREYALFKRSDSNIWQGIAGGGEANETPAYAAIRESREEAGISRDLDYLRLDSIAHIPVTDVAGEFYWGKECYVIPEYSFGVRISKTKFVISSEHTEYKWVSILEALEMLKWESNKTAIWELDKRLGNGGERNDRKKKHRIRAAALIVNEKDEVLLVQHVHPQTGDEWWVPPGGGLEDSDDSIFNCADREVYEETGLRVNSDKIVYLREFQDDENESINIEIFCLANKFSGDLTIENIQGNGADEHYIKDVRWFSKEALRNITVYPVILKNSFWSDYADGFNETKYLGRQIG
jgi:dATP pyrophosphohydrolase